MKFLPDIMTSQGGRQNPLAQNRAPILLLAGIRPVPRFTADHRLRECLSLSLKYITPVGNTFDLGQFRTDFQVLSKGCPRTGVHPETGWFRPGHNQRKRDNRKEATEWSLVTNTEAVLFFRKRSPAPHFRPIRPPHRANSCATARLNESGVLNKRLQIRVMEILGITGERLCFFSRNGPNACDGASVCSTRRPQERRQHPDHFLLPHLPAAGTT
ncbi:MAG: hypothetical protein ACK5PS_11065 [Desulfopila sp.]